MVVVEADAAEMSPATADNYWVVALDEHRRKKLKEAFEIILVTPQQGDLVNDLVKKEIEKGGLKPPMSWQGKPEQGIWDRRIMKLAKWEFPLFKPFRNLNCFNSVQGQVLINPEFITYDASVASQPSLARTIHKRALIFLADGLNDQVQIKTWSGEIYTFRDREALDLWNQVKDAGIPPAEYPVPNVAGTGGTMIDDDTQTHFVESASLQKDPNCVI